MLGIDLLMKFIILGNKIIIMRQLTIFIALISIFSCETCREHFLKKNINGIVKKKYISKNHNAHYIELKYRKGNTNLFVAYDDEVPGLWKFLQKGDSIVKPKGDSIFVVIRNKNAYKFRVACK